ncbi:DUF3885 domain-containing protein [Mesobacillus subterraneus]|uniref:DUF3885 domain-containing protein n=1 Tax=Mesobacillus subterraneus TaxID=285983 RepID=UPI003531D9E4
MSNLNLQVGVSNGCYLLCLLININRKTIFHVYDDRGCDVMSASADSIREI